MVGMCLEVAGWEVAGIEGKGFEDEIEKKKKLGVEGSNSQKARERKSRMEENARGKRQLLCLMNQLTPPDNSAGVLWA
jgi:hypothetical protein